MYEIGTDLHPPYYTGYSHIIIEPLLVGNDYS
jgi:hypothetical protein